MVGKPLAQGVAVGIDQGSIDAVAAMAGLVRRATTAGTVSSPGIGTLGIGGAAPGGGGGVTVEIHQQLTFNGAAGANPTAAANAMRQAAEDVVSEFARSLSSGRH